MEILFHDDTKKYFPVYVKRKNGTNGLIDYFMNGTPDVQFSRQVQEHYISQKEYDKSDDLVVRKELLKYKDIKLADPFGIRVKHEQLSPYSNNTQIDRKSCIYIIYKQKSKSILISFKISIIHIHSLITHQEQSRGKITE